MKPPNPRSCVEGVVMCNTNKDTRREKKTNESRIRQIKEGQRRRRELQNKLKPRGSRFSMS